MIPKRIYISWTDEKVIKNQSPLILNGIRNLIDLNPDWTCFVYTDGEVDFYLKDELDQSDYSMIATKHIVAKTDIWRLLKLFNEGGLYIDIDRFCNIPLSNILEPTTKMVLPTCGDYNFSHDFMMSAPNNPVYAIALQMMFERMKAGETNLNELGARTYMHAVTRVMFNKMIDVNPGSDIFNDIRNELNESGFVKTYKEKLPFDSIIYKHDPNTFKLGDTKVENPYDWEMLKRELYARYNLRHWTNEW